MGAIMGDADAKDAELLYHFGVNLGMAFQLQDDYLDVFGDEEVFGKKIGGDILCNKKKQVPGTCILLKITMIRFRITWKRPILPIFLLNSLLCEHNLDDYCSSY